MHARVNAAAPRVATTDKRGLHWYPWALGVLLAVALVWRLLYLQRLSATIFFGAMNADEKVYWDWATYLRTHGPLGENPFFMAPLYPYTLWALRGLLGDTVGNILVVQAVLGALSAVLLADSSSRLTRPWIGIIMGVVAAGYEMAVLHDGLILAESTLFFLEALLLWLVLRHDWRRPGAAYLAGPALVIGLAAQGRAANALLASPLAVLAVTTASTRRESVRRAVTIAGAIALTALPSAVRNYAVSGEFIPYTYNFGYNLYVGNNPHATGLYVPITQTWDPDDLSRAPTDGGVDGDGRAFLKATRHVDLGPSQSSAYWASDALAFVIDHPARALQLAGRKLLILWNREEYEQIESVDLHRLAAGPIGLPYIGSFGFVAPMALAGLWAAWRMGSPGRFVALCLLVQALAVLPFFVTDRYRLHLVPNAILLAGCWIGYVANHVGRSGAYRMTMALALVVPGAILVNLPTARKDSARTKWDIAVAYGRRWLELGRPDSAAARFKLAADMDSQGLLRGGTTLAGLLGRAGLYQDYGSALVSMGLVDDGVRMFDRAAALAPNSRSIMVAQGLAYALAGGCEQARHKLTQAQADIRACAEELTRGARAAASKADVPTAQRYLEAACCLDPTLEVAAVALIRLLIERGSLDAAQQRIREFRAAGLRAPIADAHEAWIDALSGRRTQAQATIDRLLADPSAQDSAVALVLAHVQQLLRDSHPTRRNRDGIRQH